MKKWSLLAVLSMLIMILAACSGSSDEVTSSGSEDGSTSGGASGAPADFSFGSATVGGFWYTLSGAMSEKMKDYFPNSTTTIVEGGSTSNILGMNQGIYAIGITNAPNIIEAEQGIEPFESKIENVSTIATLYPNVFHIAVRADSDIYTVEDLKGKKVSPGIKGYSAELAFLEILKAEGMSYDDLSGIEYIGTSDAGDLLRDGHIDAIANLLSAPVSTYQELDTTLGIRLIELDTETIAALAEVNSAYMEFTIKGGTYAKIKEDVKTVAAYSALMASDDLIDEETGYQLTKMMFEEATSWKTISSVMNDFTPEYSVQNTVGRLHVGAEKYYRELGLIE
ncbi:TAXI family TRAP transporter solute-binding subunit [Lysinibacillus sp. LZ02]|uniref:TAXI family TRAP transporter solute-binding subunit n=1 Tax=Lysinibacillus sp. LZ02 TaxID=3420668 RepID=UPI003D36B3A7